MQDDFRIPERLESFEAELRKIALPKSGVDQSAIMYQAGWNAALDQARLKALRAQRKWKLACGFMTTVSASLLLIVAAKNPGSAIVGPGSTTETESRPVAPDVALVEAVQDRERFIAADSGSAAAGSLFQKWFGHAETPPVDLLSEILQRPPRIDATTSSSESQPVLRGSDLDQVEWLLKPPG